MSGRDLLQAVFLREAAGQQTLRGTVAQNFLQKRKSLLGRKSQIGPGPESCMSQCYELPGRSRSRLAQFVRLLLQQPIENAHAGTSTGKG